MDRFVAFLWDPHNEPASQRVAEWRENLPQHPLGWQIVVDKPGMRIAVLNKSPQGAAYTETPVLDGLIVGSLYARHDGQAGRVSSLTPHAASDLSRTGGASLLSGHWGSYVAIWRDEASGTTHVLSDPCGAASCFTIRSDSVQVLCAHIADISALPGLHLSIDWSAVKAFLVPNYFITPHTGLREVVEILPGQRASWSRSGDFTTTWLWDPVEIAEHPSRRSFADSRDELRAIAEECFSALGRSYGKTIVRVSGGLDSSIVANLLRRKSECQVTGLHLVGRGYEAYELQLARLAAHHAGIDLLELELDASTADVASLEAAPLLARPSKQLLGASADAILQQACAALGAECVMGGHGGDNLFLQRSVATDTFVDFVRLNGVGPRFWSVAYDTAMLLERSVWRVLQGAGAFGLGLRRWSALAFLDDKGARQERLLLADGAEHLEKTYTTNPWLLEAERLPPCKAEQVRGIIALRNYHSVIGHGVEYDAVHPFISQPLVEYALRTPAYVFNEGGLDRSLERAAFADIVPAEISQRMHKGFINHQLTHDLANETTRLREFVLDGLLVSQGIVDRQRCEALLSPESLVQGDGVGALMNVLAAEAWARPWQRRSISVA